MSTRSYCRTLWGTFPLGKSRMSPHFEERRRPVYKIIPCDRQFVVAEVMFSVVNGGRHPNIVEGLRVMAIRPTEQSADTVAKELAAQQPPPKYRPR